MVSILDTNIFVRFLTGTGEDFFELSREIMHEISDADLEPSFLLEPVIIAEVIFVMNKVYKFPKKEIIKALQNIVSFPGFINTHKDEIRGALMLCQDTSLSFIDAYIVVISELQGRDIITFDAGIKKFLNKRKK